jgi:hypothetical protein
MTHRLRLSLLIFCAFALLLVAPSFGQSYNPFNERDNTYTLLGLKRAKEAYDAARAEYDRQKQLHKEGLITELELERAKNGYTDAEVNYQQSLLAVIFEDQYVSVQAAVKYQAPNGGRRVRLTFANTSGGTAEFKHLVEVEDKLFNALKPEIIHNVYVSILNNDNAIISQPYEKKISELHYGQPVTVDFELLQDLDAVTVFIVYGNGSQRTMKIFLQKDATVNRVLVQSEQFSQEIELGSSASYDLTLELFSGTSNTFSLEAVNLPQQIGRHFKDRSSSARLSQVKFTESARTKAASLEVDMPDRPSDKVAMDTPIPFFVLALPRDRIDEIGNLNRSWAEDEIKALDVGYVRLELLPRGKGELLIRSPQLYHAIGADGTAETTIDIINEGSNRIDNIEIDADLPLNWTKTITPDRIASLAIGREESISLAFSPPADIAPGKYEIRVRTSGLSDGQPITGEDKTVTVEIKADTNLLGTLLIVILLVGLIGGIVVYGVKLSRR